MAKPRNGPYICGIDAALDVVSGKWTGLILWELDNYGVRRFAELLWTILAKVDMALQQGRQVAICGHDLAQQLRIQPGSLGQAEAFADRQQFDEEHQVVANLELHTAAERTGMDDLR